MTSSVKVTRSRLLVTACFSAIFLISINFTQAQVPISGSELTVSASDNTPTAGQTVTITARSYSADLNASTITWILNGTTNKRAVGLTSLDVTAPAAGKRLGIRVVALTADGHSLSGNLTLGTGEIDLIVETEGYKPPFFAGKLSPVYQNSFRVIAMPHLLSAAGAEYDPKTLIYEWRKDDYVLESQSGYGKQTISLVGDSIPRPYILSVNVHTRDNSAQSSDSISLDYTQPSITLYSEDPLYGPLFNKALGSSLRIGSEREAGVRAVPFGFNKPQEGLGQLSWVWSVNGLTRADLTAHENIILRAPDDSAGASVIGVTIRNERDILQGADAGLDVIFSASPSTSQNSTTL
ncbi:MAG: hypothetical protein V4481_02350 [Patescibacteria group bacterium]